MANPTDNCAVKIAVRERPIRKNGEAANSVIVYHPNNANHILTVGDRQFLFDNVMGPNVSQKEVFENLVHPLVHKVLEGFNCTALAYGQTGTGKSYTMGLNSDNFEEDNAGLVPRCFKEILKFINDENSESKQELYASFIEIYNEKVYDLLAENYAEPIIARGYKFTGGSRKLMSSIDECYGLLNQGNKNRHVRPTKMNSQSSRSHAIFTIHLRSANEEQVKTSCLNLVDLAGSEGVRRTGHQGVALSEGVHINQGLLSIGKVLLALTLGNKVIPYRDSVLSSVLQDSLSPNSYLTLLACISPHREDLSETLSTLRFAQRAKHVKHTPQINSVIMEMKKKAKTPFKANNDANTPTPNKMRKLSAIKRLTGSTAANKLGYHSNTFCSPSKVHRLGSNKMNQTIVGLTPKEKKRVQNGYRTSIRTKVFQHDASNRDSLFDHPDNESIDSHRSSVFSLNISTSTAVDVPTKATSYSPVVRKCMAEFENVMENKMFQMMESIKGITSNVHHVSPSRTPSQAQCPTTSSVTDSVKNELRNIVRQELLGFSDRKSPPPTVKCQLFTTSSPVFKIPKPLQPTIKLSKSRSFDMGSTALEEDVTFAQNSNQTVMPKGLRRSRRLSYMKADSANSSHVGQLTRRSKRLSIKQINDQRRKSIKLEASPKPLSLLSEETDATRISKAASRKNQATKVNAQSGVNINNTVIESYFAKNNSKKNSNLAKHKKAILDLLNTGTMKELQILPQVGLKTAYQIVTQRTLMGKFKNFSQVEKLPIWRGTSWQRFSKANILI